MTKQVKMLLALAVAGIAGWYIYMFTRKQVNG